MLPVDLAKEGKEVIKDGEEREEEEIGRGAGDWSPLLTLFPPPIVIVGF